MSEQLTKLQATIEAHITASNAQYKDLRDALIGDEFGNDGLVKRLKITEDKTNETHDIVKKREGQFKWAMRTAWGLITGFVVWLWDKIFG